MTSQRLFVLSPASCTGERARLLLDAGARFGVARELRSGEGIEMGRVFSFMSGLYFRGKLRYAEAFARPPAAMPGVLVITPSQGLKPPDTRVDLGLLRRYAAITIDLDEPRYVRPLRRSAQALARRLAAHPGCEVVLLGSVASGKYVDLLDDVLGPRLVFPAEFIGRGDMSRGGLLLRAAEESRELGYVRLAGAMRRGPRPPRLTPRPGILTRACRP